MKSKIGLIVLSLALGLATQKAQAGFFSSLFKSVVKIVSHIPIIGNIVENQADRYAHRKLNAQLDQMISGARSCKTPETDGRFGIDFWLTQKPGLPGWENLDKLKSRSESYTSRGLAFSKYDKVQHCYVGCTISRELGQGTAVLAGWIKELKDISDCSSKTHFSIEDNEATVGGAIAAGRTSCEAFCGRPEFQSASGSYILEKAKELPVYTAVGGGSRNLTLKFMLY